MFGGKYAESSFASKYPAKRQIYLEELWELSDDGSFARKIPDSRGALFLEDSFEVIEFFAMKGDRLMKKQQNGTEISEVEELVEITKSYSPGKHRMLRGEEIVKNDKEKPPRTKSGVHRANNRA
ncbi:hypothetical protein J7M28_09725 [bacterium]|nr:hypothetical protein [bacterium]